MEEYGDPSSFEKWKLGIPKAGYWMDQAVKAWEDKYELSEDVPAVKLGIDDIVWITKAGRSFPIVSRKPIWKMSKQKFLNLRGANANLERDDYALEVLRQAGFGKPGLNIEEYTYTTRIPGLGLVDKPGKRIVYRNEDGYPIGTTSLRQTEHSIKGKPIFEIDKTGVHPDHRRKGIATTLYKKASEFGHISGYLENKGSAGAKHKLAVKEALEKGKSVPEEVLKDYPDLKMSEDTDSISLGMIQWITRNGRRIPIRKINAPIKSILGSRVKLLPSTIQRNLYHGSPTNPNKLLSIFSKDNAISAWLTPDREYASEYGMPNLYSLFKSNKLKVLDLRKHTLFTAGEGMKERPLKEWVDMFNKKGIPVRINKGYEDEYGSLWDILYGADRDLTGATSIKNALINSPYDAIGVYEANKWNDPVKALGIIKKRQIGIVKRKEYGLSEADSIALSFLNVMPKRIIRWISRHGKRFPIFEKAGKALNPVLRKSMTRAKMQRIKDEFSLLKSWSKGIEYESRIGFGANDPVKALLGDGTYIKLKDRSFQEHGFTRELIAQRVADYFGLTKYFPTKTLTVEGHLIERWIEKAETPMNLGGMKDYRFNNVINDFIRSADGRKIGMLDYVLGNGDRHTANFMIRRTDKSMHIIDNESIFNSMTIRSPFTENLLRMPLNDDEVKVLKELNSKLDKYLSINIKEISPSFHQEMKIDKYRERILRTAKKRINTLIKIREPGDDTAKRFLDANGDLRELPRQPSPWKGPG